MAWEALKSAVSAVITDNGNNEITGPILEQLLNNNIIEQLGSNLYKGIAIPSTNPDTSPETPQYYVAYQEGTYSNFGGIILKDELSIIIFNTVSSSWEKNVLLKIEPKGERDSKFNALLDVERNTTTGNTFPGRVNKADGVYIADSNWVSSDYLVVNQNTYLRRVSTSLVGGGSSVAGISFFDENKTFIGFIEGVPADLTIQPKDYYTDAYYVRVSGAASDGINVTLKSDLVSKTEDNVSGLNLVLEEKDFSTEVTNGFLDSSGVFSSAANWRSTDFILVSEGQSVKYRGVAEGNARAIIGYDENKVFVSVIAGVVNHPSLTPYTIPSNIKYVRASARMVTNDIFEFLVKSRILSNFDRDYFIPDTLYAKQSEVFKINPNGLVAKHQNDNSVDVFSNLQLSNEQSIQLTPGNSDTTVDIKIRNVIGELKEAGTINIKVTPTANIINPATAQNFICLGDSLTQGVSASGIEGAYVNELSRRLTGTGTELLTGSESPAALTLSNIYFRGTRGDQAVLHEGRGGWSAANYLNTASSGGVTNAFWNPSTSEFDLDYYLTQNNFKSSQTTGGVTPTGDNLTVIILLGWNNAYSGGVNTASTNLKLLIDKIKADMPDVKVKILGLNTPPVMNYKTFTGDRNVTTESIMRDVILPFNREYYSISQNTTYSSYVEFVNISSVFFAENSYPTTNRNAHLRDSTQIEVNTDYVHPAARGYAQIADALFYNILYNYCRS